MFNKILAMLDLMTISYTIDNNGFSSIVIDTASQSRTVDAIDIIDGMGADSFRVYADGDSVSLIPIADPSFQIDIL